MDKLFENQIHQITPEHLLFPEKLLSISSCPKELFYSGRLPDPAVPAVAIVGARMCSAYGRIQAFHFAEVLSRNGVQILSGLALGIDSEAHKGALEGSSPTFAVLGCGLDVCYPASNRKLASRILQNGGGIISEYPEGTPPLAHHFPVRNRLISALSDLVLVVEAREASGSLITAGYALDQGRPVYAIPGSVHEPLSRGTNRLIFDGAGAAISPDVILTELGITPSEKKTAEDQKRRDAAETAASPEETLYFEEKIRKVCSDCVPRSPSEIAELAGEPLPMISSLLVKLSLDGSVREIGRNRYILA